MRSVRNHVSTRATLSAVAAALAIFLAGCTSVEDTPTTLYEELNTATTADQAERAIATALRLAGIGDPNQNSRYAQFGGSQSSLRKLSEAQAAYNRGDESQGSSFRSLFEALHKTDSPPSVELDLGLEILWRATTGTLEKAEDDFDRNMVLVFAATTGSSPPATIDRFGPDAVISPLQRHLYGAWLYYSGPGMAYYALSMQDEAASKTAWVVPACEFYPGIFEIPQSFAPQDCTFQGPPSHSLVATCARSILGFTYYESVQNCMSGTFCDFGACPPSGGEANDPNGCQQDFAQCIIDFGSVVSFLEEAICENLRTACSTT